MLAGRRRDRGRHSQPGPPLTFGSGAPLSQYLVEAPYPCRWTDDEPSAATNSAGVRQLGRPRRARRGRPPSGSMTRCLVQGKIPQGTSVCAMPGQHRHLERIGTQTVTMCHRATWPTSDSRRNSEPLRADCHRHRTRSTTATTGATYGVTLRTPFAATWATGPSPVPPTPDARLRVRHEFTWPDTPSSSRPCTVSVAAKWLSSWRRSTHSGPRLGELLVELGAEFGGRGEVLSR